MTTMALVDEILSRFKGKSPRDSYRQVCEELHVHMQRDIYALLPEKPMAWHQIYSLELDSCLLGTKGCMSILPLITVSTSMRKLSLRSCGISDDFVIQLCNILQNHPSLRAVDISDNDLITVHSAPHIISVMRNNANMIQFDVFNTHVGTNVGGIIADHGMRNFYGVLHYYEDRYFRMKNLFNYMDADGRGWVLLKSLVLNCPFPVLQEQFVERIAVKKPQKRSDGTISINAFLQLVYMNYKTETEILAFVKNTVDEPYIFITANWKQLIRATERHNTRAATAQQPLLRLPDDLHRWRLRDYVLTSDDADALVEAAMQVQEHTETMQEDAEALSPFKGDSVAEEQNGEAADTASTPTCIQLPVTSLLQACKMTLAPPNSAIKPVYQFYRNNDAAYVPDILRNGSRLFSVGRMSCVFNSTTSQDRDSASSVGAGDDSDDAPHTFSLPASLVKMLVEFFEREYAKIPKKKPSTVPDSPRTRRDKGMEKPSIPVKTLFCAEFTTNMEQLRPRLLADDYARHALSIEDNNITLQEMVNMLDETYVQCRIDRVMPLEEIEAMPNPLKEESLREFFVKHLAERGEDISILDPFEDAAHPPKH